MSKWEYTVPNERAMQSMAHTTAIQAKVLKARPETMQIDYKKEQGHCITAYCDKERYVGFQVLIGGLTSSGVAREILRDARKELIKILQQ